MISIEHLTFAYATTTVFRDISLSFEEKLNVIIGPNAAGKTTLLRCLFGLLHAEGRISWQGTDLARMPREERMNLMVYLPQQDMSDTLLTVFEATLLGRIASLGWTVSPEDLERVYRVLQGMRIHGLATRYVNELSGGQRKLVAIAQTLVRDPSVVLMDEPTNSLDMQKQLELFDMIKQITARRDIMFIVVMHDLNLSCRYADHLVVLDGSGGVYATGKPEDVVSSEMLHDVYGVDATIIRDRHGIPIVAPTCSLHQVDYFAV